MDLASEVEALVGDLAGVRAPRGPQLRCKGWQQEAALRMLCNNLDPEVAEDPADLVVYGGTGPGGPSHGRCDAIVRTLIGSATTRRCWCRAASRSAVFRTHAGAPRVLIANSLLVPRFATWDEFRGWRPRA